MHELRDPKADKTTDGQRVCLEIDDGGRPFFRSRAIGIRTGGDLKPGGVAVGIDAGLIGAGAGQKVDGIGTRIGRICTAIAAAVDGDIQTPGKGDVIDPDQLCATAGLEGIVAQGRGRHRLHQDEGHLVDGHRDAQRALLFQIAGIVYLAVVVGICVAGSNKGSQIIRTEGQGRHFGVIGARLRNQSLLFEGDGATDMDVVFDRNQHRSGDTQTDRFREDG